MTRIQVAAPIYAALVGPRIGEGSELAHRETGGLVAGKLDFYASRALAAADVLLKVEADERRAKRAPRRHGVQR